MNPISDAIVPAEFVIELAFLKGRAALSGVPAEVLITYA